MSVKGALIFVAQSALTIVARSPAASAACLRVARAVLRRAPYSLNKQRIVNTLSAAPWVELELDALPVKVGSVSVMLQPHVGEFDFQFLFEEQTSYEPEVVALLESRAAEYDAVVEIGANVGFFTTFLSVLLENIGSKAPIFAFEPSRQAFGRLQTNLQLNGGSNVAAFNCAVSDSTGFLRFFEPQGHLTNGSLRVDIPRMFATDVRETTVLAVGGDVVQSLVAPHERVLLKIDVEGAEAAVLRGLRGLLEEKQPDLVLEVLPIFEDELNALPFLASHYRLFNITDAGLIEHDRFRASEHRDYLLLGRRRMAVGDQTAAAELVVRESR